MFKDPSDCLLTWPLSLHGYFMSISLVSTSYFMLVVDVRCKYYSSIDIFALWLARLSERYKASESKKEELAAEIKTKKEYLESLQPKLSTILQVPPLMAVSKSTLNSHSF